MKVCPYEQDFPYQYGREDFMFKYDPIQCCLQPAVDCPKNPKNKGVEILVEKENVDEFANSILSLEV